MLVVSVVTAVVFFFCKQKTAYEMRISDWSSDVCSSDLSVDVGARWLYAVAQAHALEWEPRSRYERLTLRRASQDVPTEAIEAALREALADQGIDGEVQLVLDNPEPRLRLPSSSDGGLRKIGRAHV